MLGQWQTHAEYQRQTADALSIAAKFNPFALREYERSISKLYILDLDPLKELVAPLYSNTGRPSENQPEIFRSIVLMNSLGFELDEWMGKLSNNYVLRTACGFRGKLPGIASFYDFINRIIKLDEKPRHKPKKRKPKEKYGKGKMPPKHPNIVQRLVDRILKGRRFNCRPERLLQEIFAKVAVQPSIDLGLVPKTVSVSGDGTCIETGAASYGRRTCGCADFHCGCPRKFSDDVACSFGLGQLQRTLLLWPHGVLYFHVQQYGETGFAAVPSHPRRQAP